MIKPSVVAVLGVLVAPGCVSTPSPQQPVLSLSQAICEIQNAIVETRREGHTAAGLTPSEAIVTLQLGVKRTATAGAGGEFTVGIVDWGASYSRSHEGTHGNTLTIKFVPGSTHVQMQTPGSPAANVPQTVNLPDCQKEFPFPT